MSFIGKIKLYTGPMFSGKSTLLLRDYERYSLSNKKCILIKYSKDNRYINHITHNNNFSINDKNEIGFGIKINMIDCNYLFEADNDIKNYDVVFIDEIQFFKDNYIFCEKWANEGKYIILAGLISTFERKLFSGMDLLLPLIEEIITNPAVCLETYNDAYFTTRTTNDKEETIIGKNDIYKSVDRYTYYKNDEIRLINYVNMIQKFNDIMNEKNKTNNILDIDKVKKFIISHYFYFNFEECIKRCLIN